MTYGWVKNYALQLINRYSLSGNILPSHYNDQQDYLNRIPALVDDAVMYIATTVRPIPDCIKLSELAGEELGEYMVYEPPAGLYKFKSGGIVCAADGGMRRFNAANILGNGKIIIPRELESGILEYYRYPHALSDPPADSEELDNTPDTHTAVPYYVAAHLMLDDNEFGYTALYNEFEAKLERLELPQQAENISILNEYAANM